MRPEGTVATSTDHHRGSTGPLLGVPAGWSLKIPSACSAYGFSEPGSARV
ncbi:MAG: hypothetical protein LAT64_04210 [Phycisphaerales bacterium]|nr:hypothetical protein [Planctomycetota bacterium]MCH8507956.1 hypothetical protein [Phycisphaerales bacterium]